MKTNFSHSWILLFIVCGLLTTGTISYAENPTATTDNPGGKEEGEPREYPPEIEEMLANQETATGFLNSISASSPTGVDGDGLTSPVTGTDPSYQGDLVGNSLSALGHKEPIGPQIVGNATKPSTPSPGTPSPGSPGQQQENGGGCGGGGSGGGSGGGQQGGSGMQMPQSGQQQQEPQQQQQQQDLSGLQQQIADMQDKLDAIKERLEEEDEEKEKVEKKMEALAKVNEIILENYSKLTDAQKKKLKEAISKISKADTVEVNSDGSVTVDSITINADGTVS
ncbi:MAG: DUF5320 family protein [Verrucomicrobiota bacterium]